MSEQHSKPAEERVLSRYILPSSGTMLGMSTTLIGLVKVAEGRIGPNQTDEYASLASLFFLFSAISSYIAVRNADREWLSRRCEFVADICFLIGLLSLSVIGLFFAYEMI